MRSCFSTIIQSLRDSEKKSVSKWSPQISLEEVFSHGEMFLKSYGGQTYASSRRLKSKKLVIRD